MNRLLFSAALIWCCMLQTSLAGSGNPVSVHDTIVRACGYGGGGRFTTVAVDPHDPNVVLVGSDVAGVFKSTDGGAHFRLTGRGLESFAIASLAFVPTQPGTVFLLAWDGCYMSRDRGDHWVKKSSTICYRQRYSGNSLFAIIGQKLYIATDTGNVFQMSLDNGSAPVSAIPSSLPAPVFCLAAANGLLYAGTDQGVFCYRTAAWQQHNNGLPEAHRRVTSILSLSEGRLYALEETTGLYLWNATANAWKAVGVPAKPQTILQQKPLRYKACALVPGKPETLYLATHPETWPHMLFKSDDGGATWSQCSRFSRAQDAVLTWHLAASLAAAECISPVPRSRTLYLTDWWNIWKTTDAGDHWTQLHRGLQNTVVNDIKTDPRKPGFVFMAVSDNGLMVSPDNGTTWQRKMSGVVDGHAQEIEISRQDSAVMYLLINPWEKKKRIALYRSNDGGEHWNDVGFSLPDSPLPRLGYVDGLATNIEIDHADDRIVYVATNGYGIFKTTDSGRTWSPLNSGITTPYVRGPSALLMHPHDSSVLFASTQAGGLYRTTDAGRLWHRMPTGHNFTFGMAIDPGDPSRIYVGCPAKKIVRTTDGGATWRETTLPGKTSPTIAAYALSLHPQDTRIVFVGTLSYDYTAADGLYISRDSGQTFEKCSLDLPEVTINALHCTQSASREALLGFNGIGMFRVVIATDTP